MKMPSRLISTFALALFVATALPSVTVAQTFIGPFVAAQSWWLSGSTVGVIPDGSLLNLFIDTNGDGLIGGAGDNTHPYPAAIRNGLQTKNYRLSPSREVLYVFGAPNQDCGPGFADTKIYLYQIPATDGAPLEPIVVGECLSLGIAFEGFFDYGSPGQQIFFAVERANTTTLQQSIFWVDLVTGAHGYTQPDFSQIVADVKFDPNGYAAFVQYDTGDGDNAADYRLIQLCADAIGAGYSQTPGPLGQYDQGIPTAEVVDAGGTANIRVSDGATNLLEVPLIDCGLVSVDVGACCFPDGSCADGVTQSACESVTNGGTWQGVNSLCANTNCPQPPAPVLVLGGSAPTSAAPQTPYTTNLTWSNTGTAPLTNMSVQISLPTSVNYVGSTGNGIYNPGNRTVLWSVGTLNDGSNGGASLTVEANCGVNFATLFSYRAFSTEIPFQFGPNFSTTITAPPTTPLTVNIASVADNGQPVLNGETITHTFVIDNPSPDNVPVLSFTTALGAYQELDAVLNDGGGVATFQTNWITWNGSIGANSQITIEVRMRISDCRPASATETVMANGGNVIFAVPCGGSLATVPGTSPIALGDAQVALSLTATNLNRATGGYFSSAFGTHLARPGSALDLELTLENKYNRPANGLTVSSVLPASFVPSGNPPFVGTPPSGTTWDSGTQTITWTGDLAANTVLTIAFAAALDSTATGTVGMSAGAQTSACPFLASATVSVLVVPPPYPGPHLLTLTPFNGILRTRPGVDVVAQSWVPINFEIFWGFDEGMDDDLWMVGFPIVRFNPKRLELEAYGDSLFSQLQIDTVRDVAVDRTSGMVYFAGIEGLGSPSRDYLRVRAFNPSTGNIGVLFDDTPVPNPTYGTPSNMVLDPGGNLAVTVASGVLRIDPSNPGAATLDPIPELTQGSGLALALDANGDYLIAENSFLSPKALVRMDRTTGQTTTVVPDLDAIGLPNPVALEWAAFDGVDKLYLLSSFSATGTVVDLSGPPTASGAFFGSFANSDLLWYSGAPTGTAIPTAGETTPQRVSLASVHPNPFNPRTTITYALPRDARVKLTVHDLRGREVAILLDELRPSGQHRVVWNGLDTRHQPVASGVYFARLQALGKNEVRKMVLVR